MNFQSHCQNPFLAENRYGDLGPFLRGRSGFRGTKDCLGAPRTDPCKAFCRCSNKWEQNACLEACRNCNKDISRLCGSCWSGYACTDLSDNVFNCGACFHNCGEARPNEQSACLDGECVYDCVAGRSIVMGHASS